MNELRKLYQVLPEQDETQESHMEGLSRAFGLLLHATGAKSPPTQAQVVPRICEMVCILPIYIIQV